MDSSAEGLKRSSKNTPKSQVIKPRIDHLVQVTPELVVRKRIRTVDSSSEEEQPAAKKMASEQDIMTVLAGLQASMGELKKKVDSIPTREDFDKIGANVNSIRRGVAENTERLDELTKRHDEEQRDFLRNVEKVIDKRMAYHKTTRSGVLTPTPDESDKEKQKLERRSDTSWRTCLRYPHR